MCGGSGLCGGFLFVFVFVDDVDKGFVEVWVFD